MLTCTVTVVEDLVVRPSVEWSGGSVGSGEGVMVGDTDTSGVNSTRDITFNPLNTSHGAQYTCEATINVESIGLLVADNSSRDVRVQSKCVK